MKAIAAFSCGWLLSGGVPARSQDVSAWSALTESELAEIRGGYYTAGGLTFDFGAQVRTFVDGQLALSTSLTWTPGGLQSASTAGGANQPLAGTQLASVLAALGYGSTTPAGAGVVVGSQGSGATVVLQQLDASHIANVVLNTADGRSIRQDTTLTLSLPQLPNLQQSQVMLNLGRGFSDQMTSALRSSSPH